MRSQAGKPVPLDQVGRPFPGQRIMALSAPPLATCLHRQEVLGLGVKGAFPGEPTLSFQIIFWLFRTPSSLPQSPQAHLFSLPALCFLSSLLHTEAGPCHECACSWPKNWLRGSHLQGGEERKAGLGCVGQDLRSQALRVPQDDGWSRKWGVRKAGWEAETEHQASSAKPRSTPGHQGLWRF